MGQFLIGVTVAGGDAPAGFIHDGTTGLRRRRSRRGANRSGSAGQQFFLHDSAGNGPSLKYAGSDVVAGQFGTGRARGGEGWDRLPAGLEERQRRPVPPVERRQQRQLEEPDRRGLRFLVCVAVAGGGAPAGFQPRRHDRPQDDDARDVGRDNLVQVANPFFLHDSARSGPSRKYAGSDVVAGQFGAWTPLGRRRLGAATRLSGRTAAPTSTSSGTSTATETGRANPTWSQLPRMRCSHWRRRSSRISTPTARPASRRRRLETAGATDLVQVANEFFLRDQGPR